MKKLDLNRLKNKVAQLKGEKPSQTSTRKSVFWSAPLPKGETTKEYSVFLLPWSQDCDYPFEERWFYYALGSMKDEKGFSLKNDKGDFISAPLTLKQFGEPDPIAELLKELWSKEGKEEEEAKQDIEDAKKLSAQQTAYIPVIVKGEESLGPRLWKISSKKIYERLVELFMKQADYGNLIDPENQRWITVTVVEEPKKKYPMNKSIKSVDPKFSKEPLSESQEQIEEWLNNIPNLEDALSSVKYDYNGLKKLLKMWTESVQQTSVDEGEGTEGASSVQKVEKKEDDKKKSSRPKKKDEEPMKKEEALKELDSFFNDDDDEDE